MKTLKTALLYLCLSTPALAVDYADDYFAKNFKSPTGNIVCQGDGITADDQPNRGVSCYIFDHNTTPKTQDEKDCDLDWTTGYTVLAQGRGKYTGVCHGDIFWQMNAPTLNYGQTIKGKGWQCTSKKTGMTCTNQTGGGFLMNKSTQKAW